MTNREWKLWLDDIRRPPNHEDFIWCRDCDVAIYYTKMWGPPTFMALDHDLGLTIPNQWAGNGEYEDVFRYLRWLANEHGDFVPDYRVHSANTEGQKALVSFMESWKKSLEM